ncbi:MULTISPECIES: Tn3 family transposase [Bacillus]|uniref:Tn3 family transposase n=1 Tax=Bacillus TaxID=1386 RepID=UPI0015F5590E|nr:MULTISPECIES: Tn3 family transposase [Bacillus]MCC2458355.1 Tn3 family transposase [Bacillus cereus]
MPVDFLTPEQEVKYGCFSETPTSEQLAKYFWLDDKDKELIWNRRGAHNQLGFTVQLGTVRFLGTFLSDPTDVPPVVVTYMANQLGLDAKNFGDYQSNRNHWEHMNEIRSIYEYKNFTDQPGHWRLVRWLYTRAWLHNDRPSILFDFATARCIEQKILLPGVSVLTKLVAKIRDRASENLWKNLAELPCTEQRKQLENLLQSDPEKKKTHLDRLSNPPFTISVTGIKHALHRLQELRQFEAEYWDTSGIPAKRLQQLARHAVAVRSQAISRMHNERRIAVLVAFAKIYTQNAQDDVIDILNRYLTDLFAKTFRKEQKERLRTIKDLDKAARQLREACITLLEHTDPSIHPKVAVFKKVPEQDLIQAVQIVDSLTCPPDQTLAYSELLQHYGTIRKFLPLLMEEIELQATPAGLSILQAWNFVKEHGDSSKKIWKNAPLVGLNTNWSKIVIDKKTRTVNHRAYTFWMLEQVVDALRRHDLYIVGSVKYGDLRAQLLQGEEWKSIRPNILRSLDWPLDSYESLAPLKRELDLAYHQIVENWDNNPAVQIETFAGKQRITLTPLQKLQESETLKIFKKRIQDMLPNIDIPQLLLEVNRWTGFMNAFRHISEAKSRINELPISICALLISQACNIGLRPLFQDGVPALARDRLTWIEQNYFRAETLTEANTRLVDFHSQLELANMWGGGEIASADGLRFFTPVKSVHSGPNPKYFGTGRGVTFYNFTSDQFTGLHGLVIPGTIHDSLYLLQCVLEQDTSLQPKEIMTDTAGYSDIIFGLFGLLGYQFSPRLADVGESRLWRFNATSDYGILNPLSKRRIREDLIHRHWEDMLRVAGSLSLNKVNATHLIQALQQNGKPTMLGRAIGEFGRIFKTRYLLLYLNDENYRRKILTQLNRGEARHSLARSVFYGKRGELHQAYRAGQEDQLGALGLVVNAIVLWNTRYMESALQVLRNRDHTLDDNDIARISPLGHEHINIVGRYSFILPEEIKDGRLRSLLYRESNEIE